MTLSLRGSKCGMKVMPCRSPRVWLQTSVVMVQLAMSVVFFPHSLSFPVRLLCPLGDVVPTVVVLLWKQAGLLTDHSVRNTRKWNSITASPHPLAILAGRNPLPAAPRTTSLISL